MASAFPFSDAAMNQPQPPGVILSTGHPSLVHAEHSEESKELNKNPGEKGAGSPLCRSQEADQWSEKDYDGRQRPAPERLVCASHPVIQKNRSLQIRLE
jgi:hypothetical protein